jgi:hypothetical protein
VLASPEARYPQQHMHPTLSSTFTSPLHICASEAFACLFSTSCRDHCCDEELDTHRVAHVTGTHQRSITGIPLANSTLCSLTQYRGAGQSFPMIRNWSNVSCLPQRYSLNTQRQHQGRLATASHGSVGSPSRSATEIPSSVTGLLRLASICCAAESHDYLNRYQVVISFGSQLSQARGQACRLHLLHFSHAR